MAKDTTTAYEEKPGTPPGAPKAKGEQGDKAGDERGEFKKIGFAPTAGKNKPYEGHSRTGKRGHHGVR